MSVIFMTRDETARALRLSLRTVDSLIGHGEIAIRRIGRRVLIPTDEVKRFATALHDSFPEPPPTAAGAKP
jgi:excisionase family DNA binding protein